MRLLLVAVLLAGCASSLDSANLQVTGGGMELQQDQPFDADTRPTAPLYDAQGREHPGFYNLHDLLFEWASQHDHELETEFYDGDFGYGFTLCAVDGFPAAVADGEERGCFERGGYWAINVDGKAAEVGMSDLVVNSGASYLIEWTPL